MWAKRKQPGFTIVELLIVIVVIAILAAITVVAYNGLQARAKRAQVTSITNQIAKKIEVYRLENNQYPSSLSMVDIPTPPSGITYDYAQNGEWFCFAAKASVNNTIVAAGKGKDGKCYSLNASYYNNMTLEGTPVLTRTDSNIDFEWGSGSPAREVTENYFSASWEGYLTAPVTGAYAIYGWYDDRMKVYLDNSLVADWWSVGCCAWRTFSYSFTANQKVPIRVEMSESAGGAGARLHWSYPGQAQTAIPGTVFSAN